MDIDCFEIFKIPVFSQKISLDNDSIKNFCLIQKNKSKSVIKSNVGGWQSEEILDIPKELENLFFYIEDISLNVCKKLKLNPVKFSNAWININEYMHSNSEHIHPKCILSGVYYVKTPLKCGNIVFSHPSFQLISYTWDNPCEYNEYNSQSWWLPSEEGTVYIFPSWLMHKVETNLNENEERISISFNLS